MANQLTIADQISIPYAPAIPGLGFRHYRGNEDLPLMLDVINRTVAIDDLEWVNTLENITNNYRHLENCDTAKDMLMAEMDGELIAYSRCFWEKQEDETMIFAHFGYLVPEWRRKGIGSAMLKWAESRLIEVAQEVALEGDSKGPHFYQTNSFDTQYGCLALYEKNGYQPVRYEFGMKRPISDPLPEAPIPEGLEVRPVLKEHIRPIWDAMQEAFRDHWGFIPESEEKYQAWQGESTFQPELWKVAWEGDQVAGMVLNFINQEENDEFKRKRGYTEGISVRRPWRKRGLARSLIVQSILKFKEMGMTETALGVDSQNLSGALRLYQGVGYKQYKQARIYRKDMK